MPQEIIDTLNKAQTTTQTTTASQNKPIPASNLVSNLTPDSKKTGGNKRVKSKRVKTRLKSKRLKNKRVKSKRVKSKRVKSKR